jgi:hypothetical protein
MSDHGQNEHYDLKHEPGCPRSAGCPDGGCPCGLEGAEVLDAGAGVGAADKVET